VGGMKLYRVSQTKFLGNGAKLERGVRIDGANSWRWSFTWGGETVQLTGATPEMALSESDWRIGDLAKDGHHQPWNGQWEILGEARPLFCASGLDHVERLERLEVPGGALFRLVARQNDSNPYGTHTWKVVLVWFIGGA